MSIPVPRAPRPSDRPALLENMRALRQTPSKGASLGRVQGAGRSVNWGMLSFALSVVGVLLIAVSLAVRWLPASLVTQFLEWTGNVFAIGS